MHRSAVEPGAASPGLDLPRSERELAALAAALAGDDAPLTAAERALAASASPPSPARLEQVRLAIARGRDPLGETFCRLRSPETRRARGAVYTPRPIVEAMVAWAARQAAPARVVDPGAGSGRFLLAAAQAFPSAELVAVENDPLAALMLRANAAARGPTRRLTVLVDDYRSVRLPRIDGATLFLGNPPYVRHHGISPEWKAWFAETASRHGLKASKLAGLHIHFFLKTRELAAPGDYGAFITSAEWLDVNYGDVMRRLLVDGLGGAALHVIAAEAMPFAGAATTGAITCFHTGRRNREMRFRLIEDLSRLGSLAGGRRVARSSLGASRRWSPILRPPAPAPRGYGELGELCRVHRGQVTGCNAVWIAGAFAGALPDSVLIPTVTRARELFDATPDLSRAGRLRRVIDLPVELGRFDEDEGRQIRRFLAWARSRGADTSYVARNRRAGRAWWAVRRPSSATAAGRAISTSPTASIRAIPCPLRSSTRLRRGFAAG